MKEHNNGRAGHGPARGYRGHGGEEAGRGAGRRGPMSAQAAGTPFPLSLANKGEVVRIVALRAGRGLDRRLTEMGLHIGSELCVRQSPSGGALVVTRGEGRLALGAGMAHKILVSPVAAPLT